MVLLAKVALGITSALAMATVYTFHEGLIHVDVDTVEDGGTHVHFWVPATVVPVALEFAPRHKLREAAERVKPLLPALRILSKELENYPTGDFVEVQDHDQHVKIRTRNGSLLIDVDAPGENVHLRVPTKTLDHVARELEANASPE
ncbi:MAG TPA: hypothetical protein VN982_00410 [Candidatus Dormibacteraeota bacterium]|nr:hypothetical protein [Candidatus Dormibacteraeota bacterium]